MSSNTDGLYVTDSTDIQQIYDYVEQVITNPHVEIDEQTGTQNVVWNFSTHPIDESGLDVVGKERSEFLIPYQVTGVWGPMFLMLPERVRRAEVLVWHPDKDAYYAYRQFYRSLDDEQARFDGFRSTLARKIDPTIESQTGAETGVEQ